MHKLYRKFFAFAIVKLHKIYYYLYNNTLFFDFFIKIHTRGGYFFKKPCQTRYCLLYYRKENFLYNAPKITQDKKNV